MLYFRKKNCGAVKGLCSIVIIVLLHVNAYGIDNETKFNLLPTDNVKTIFDWNDINQFWFRNKGEHGSKTAVPINSMPFTEALEIRTNTKPDYDHYLSLSLNTPIPLIQNDIILISFYARATVTNNDGIGRMGFVFQRSDDPYTVHVDWPLIIGPQWQRYYIPFSVQVRRGFGTELTPAIPSGGDNQTFAVDEVRFRLKFGYLPQTIQIADLKGVNYGPDLLGEKLPYTSIKNETGAIILSGSLSDANYPDSSWTPIILSDAKAGKKFLPDFSYAGYHHGEDALPDNDTGRTLLNVTDFGAVADDSEDDTSAIQNAISEATKVNGPVTLQFPAGRFKISEIIFIQSDNFIVRGGGSGANGTVLEIVRPMKEMQKPPLILEREQDIINSNSKTGHGDYYSPFSWIGGVIWIDIKEHVPAEPLASVSGGCKRGEHVITVNSVNKLSVGQAVQLRWYDQENGATIIPHIFNCDESALSDGFGSALFNAPQVWQIVTIKAIDGNKITFKEPINHDIRQEWNVELRRVGFISEVGFEGFKIEFQESKYAGHHTEHGYNGIYLRNAIHSWVRDVEIVNCDSGVLVDKSKNITVKDVKISGRGGHYSLMARNSDQVLFRDFKLFVDSGTDGAIHNPSFNTACRASVFTHGRINTALLDQHNGLNCQNLWDDLEISGVLGSLWEHGGSSEVRPTHGAFNTGWNLRFKSNQKIPVRANDITDGPSAYFIGLASDAPLMFKYGPNAYIEGLNRHGIAIPSLYEYQLKQRTGEITFTAKPAATVNPSGNNPLEVFFYNNVSGDSNHNIAAYQWRLGTTTEPNGTLIGAEKNFTYIFPALGVYNAWLRVKNDVSWSEWERVEVALRHASSPQIPKAPLNLRVIP
jgi:hypothetical protein